jgi:putative transposase
MDQARAIKRDGHSSLHGGRYSVPGQIHLVTFTTVERQALFADHPLARSAARAVEDERLWYRSRLLAWILMPDHWHGLIELGELDSLSICIQKLKANCARSVRAERPGIKAVWAAGFHDRALRSDEDLKSAARYLVANPIRAGLVRQVGDYSYWNTVWL